MFRIVIILLLLSGTTGFAQGKKVFLLCGDKEVYPYYYLEASGNYIPDFYQVKELFKTQFHKENYTGLQNNTGILHITFWVNCKGETGNYSIESFDFNYKYCELNDKIKQDVLNLVQSLKIWKPIEELQKVQNFHQYYIFKIQGGEITDILPK